METHTPTQLPKQNQPAPSRRPLLLLLGAALLLAPTGGRTEPEATADISQQIFDLMMHAPGTQPGYRVLHAKGIVCRGTFAPSSDAATISRAAHFHGAAVPVTV